MPVVGEVRTAKALGLKDHHARVWVICPVCNKGRWAARNNIRRRDYSGRCISCASNHPLWESKEKLDMNTETKRHSGMATKDKKWLVLTESKRKLGTTETIHLCGNTVMGKKVALTEQNTLSKMLDPLAGGGETRIITVPYCPGCEREPTGGWIDIDTGQMEII